MKIGIRTDCRSCSEPIALCQVRGGKWVPFELAMAAYTSEIVDAYLPVARTVGIAALMPIEEISERRMQGVRWVAVRHRCAEYLRSKAAAYQGHIAKREHVADLTHVIEQWIKENA